MTEPITLSALELVAATGGLTHYDAQARVLRELGVHCEVVKAKRGKPTLLVSRQHYQAVMAGRPKVIEAANEPGDEGNMVDRAAVRRVAYAKQRRPA